MPLLLGVSLVLFQIGILCLDYLNVLALGRDVARWLVVHPDTTDDLVQVHVSGTLPERLDASRLTIALSPSCMSSSSCRSSRPSGQMQTVTLTYDASSHVFLPASLSLAGLTLAVPTQLPPYRYTMLVEPR